MEQVVVGLSREDIFRPAVRVLPLVKSVSQISSDWLLSVGDVSHPVLGDLPHLNVELPPIETDIFLWVSVTVVLQASDCSSHETSDSLISQVTDLAHLIKRVPFLPHEIFQIADI